MWTDEELAGHERSIRKAVAAQPNGGVLFHDTPLKDADLYRLARLGLAAEQVGRNKFQDCASSESAIAYGSVDVAKSVLDFTTHPAWRR